VESVCPIGGDPSHAINSRTACIELFLSLSSSRGQMPSATDPTCDSNTEYNLEAGIAATTGCLQRGGHDRIRAVTSLYWLLDAVCQYQIPENLFEYDVNVEEIA
jgi:hypothetical protein